MNKFQARTIIEALRSGISSRDVGFCFSSARPKMLREFQNALDKLSEDGGVGGRVLSGKYGEGKTHMLNTILSMAESQRMVASYITLSKETPLSNMAQVYSKILQGTFLPGSIQTGITTILENLPSTGKTTSELLEYALSSLETNKLYYLLKSYLGTQNEDEKYKLLADIEGNFITPAELKSIYKRIYSQNAVYNKTFVKSRHMIDYLSFLSKLFVLIGYNGWVLLVDEVELTGRLGKGARQKAYLNMSTFMRSAQLESFYSVFAFNASYVPDVIEAKHEHANVEENQKIDESVKKILYSILDEIESASQLAPLTREEIMEILIKIQDYHAIAYDWNPKANMEDILAQTEQHGYLLRTRIRTAVEMLDQLYQYGASDGIQYGELGEVTFEEDDVSEEDDASLSPFIDD